MADSARWERFSFRPDDVVISTPSKSGTTWMQHVVGMLLLQSTELGAPISQLSPWLDMLVRSDDEVFGLLEAQTHRRFIKTHTPLDGVPRLDSVTYITVVRHPLDVALSNADHFENERGDRAVELRIAAVGPVDRALPDPEPPPEDVRDYLRWFIDNDRQPTGSGPYGLEDYCNQILTYWRERRAPNVHLFHYADLWADLGREMRRVAAALAVPIDEERWPSFVQAAGLCIFGGGDADRLPQRQGRAPVPIPEHVHGRSEEVGRRVVDSGDVIPSLPQPEEGVLHDLLRLVAVTGDEAEGPEQPCVLGCEEHLEAPRFLGHLRLHDLLAAKHP